MNQVQIWLMYEWPSTSKWELAEWKVQAALPGHHAGAKTLQFLPKTARVACLNIIGCSQPLASPSWNITGDPNLAGTDCHAACTFYRIPNEGMLFSILRIPTPPPPPPPPPRRGAEKGGGA